MLKALSHSLQVEFTYIKSGKQVRFMVDSNIKTLSLSLSLSLLPPSLFPLYHTDSSACSWLLMCGSRAGWKTYCSINHVPFFSATHSTRRLSETEATFSQPLCENAGKTNIPPNRFGATSPSNCTYSDSLISNDVPPSLPVPWLTLCWQYLNIQSEECVLCSNKASFSPVLCQ